MYDAYLMFYLPINRPRIWSQWRRGSGVFRPHLCGATTRLSYFITLHINTRWPLNCLMCILITHSTLIALVLCYINSTLNYNKGIQGANFHLLRALTCVYMFVCPTKPFIQPSIKTGFVGTTNQCFSQVAYSLSLLLILTPHYFHILDMVTLLI